MDLQSDEEDDSAIVAHASPSSLSSSGFSLSSPSPPVPLPAPFRASQSSPSPLSPFGGSQSATSSGSSSLDEEEIKELATVPPAAPGKLDCLNNYGSLPFRGPLASGLPQPVLRCPNEVANFFRREETSIVCFAAGGSHAINEAVQAGISLVLRSRGVRTVRIGWWGWYPKL